MSEMDDREEQEEGEGSIEAVYVTENGDILYAEYSSGDEPEAKLYAHHFALCVSEMTGVFEVDGVKLPPEPVSVLRFQAGGSCADEDCPNEHLIEILIPMAQVGALRDLLIMALDGAL